MKSNQAQAAAAIRQELKKEFPGIKFRVTSEGYSMGDRVTIEWTDGPTTSEVVKYTGKYQYGSFNGMEDIYEITNNRTDIPQSKYVRESRTMSEDTSRVILEALEALDHFRGDENFYNRREQVAYRIFCQTSLPAGAVVTGLERTDVRAGQMEEFYRVTFTAPTTTAAPVAAGSGFSISEHYHDKHGFNFWLVVLSGRVDRDQFTALRDSAQAAGGWYSRQWKGTPGGFAFKSPEAAQQWAEANLTGTDTQPDPDKPTKPRTDTATAEKLRTLAEGMDKQIQDKLADRLTNTPKRQREAASHRIEGHRLKRTQEALRALADLHEAGTVPAVLAEIKSKKAVYELMATRTTSSGYYNISDTNEPYSTTPEAVALWSLITGKTEAEQEAEKLQAEIQALQFLKIPGYFPTPAALVRRMLDKADIKTHHKVLEPSAGSGAILDLLPECNAVCYEVNYKLSNILQAKGYTVLGSDFMEAEPGEYDRIIMNPPFENLQDIDHIRRAFDMLKPGGRLVAICSQGPFFRNDKKAQEFRAWFEELGGVVDDIEAGAFKESGTGVASKMVVLDKPEAVQLIKTAHNNITRHRPEYAPDVHEIQAEVNRITGQQASLF